MASFDDRRGRLAQSVLLSVHTGGTENADLCLKTLHKEFGWTGVFYAAFVWMDMTATMNKLTAKDLGYEPLAALMTFKDGKPVSLDETNTSPGMQVAMQAFTAFLARQHETAKALLSAGVTNGHSDDMFTSLLSICALLSHDELEKRRDDITIGT